jgi:hypothetical protein
VPRSRQGTTCLEASYPPSKSDQTANSAPSLISLTPRADQQNGLEQPGRDRHARGNCAACAGVLGRASPTAAGDAGGKGGEGSPVVTGPSALDAAGSSAPQSRPDLTWAAVVLHADDLLRRPAARRRLPPPPCYTPARSSALMHADDPLHRPAARRRPPSPPCCTLTRSSALLHACRYLASIL